MLFRSKDSTHNIRVGEFFKNYSLNGLTLDYAQLNRAYTYPSYSITHSLPGVSTTTRNLRLYYQDSTGEETSALNTSNLGERKRIAYKFIDDTYVDVVLDASNIERVVEVDDWQVSSSINGNQEHLINIPRSYTDQGITINSVTSPGSLTNYSYAITIRYDRTSSPAQSDVSLVTNVTANYNQRYRITSTVYPHLWKENTDRDVKVDNYLVFDVSGDLEHYIQKNRPYTDRGIYNYSGTMDTITSGLKTAIYFENSKDDVFNNLTTTLHNNPTLNSNGLNSDVTSDKYLSITEDPMKFGDNVTIELWYYLSSKSDWQPIFSFSDDSLEHLKTNLIHSIWWNIGTSIVYDKRIGLGRNTDKIGRAHV